MSPILPCWKLNKLALHCASNSLPKGAFVKLKIQATIQILFKPEFIERLTDYIDFAEFDRNRDCSSEYPVQWTNDNWLPWKGYTRQTTYNGIKHLHLRLLD